MSYTYNVITPMRRYENLEKLVTMLTTHRATSNVVWHVVFDDDAPFHVFFKQPWIHAYYQNNSQSEFWARCNFAINRWLDTHVLAEDERYLILNDDDMVELGYFAKLDEHKGSVVISSMKRGDQTPAGVPAVRCHAPNTLEAKPENMAVGHVGVEQITISGALLKSVRLPLSVAGDGEMISWVVANHGAEYAPEAFVLFNFLEAGRWNNPTL